MTVDAEGLPKIFGPDGLRFVLACEMWSRGIIAAPLPSGFFVRSVKHNLLELVEGQSFGLGPMPVRSFVMWMSPPRQMSPVRLISRSISEQFGSDEHGDNQSDPNEQRHRDESDGAETPQLRVLAKGFKRIHDAYGMVGIALSRRRNMHHLYEWRLLV